MDRGSGLTPTRRPGDAKGVAAAVEILARGDVVGMPTETVYGLAADATSTTAVARIFAAKGRPSHNPLIAHVLDLEAASALVQVDERARVLARAFWPGPLTMVLPRREDADLAPALTAGLPTLAVRAPAHPVARALLAAFGRPLAAPSANASGTLSPTRGEHVRLAIPLVLDGGPSAVGLESTIVDLSGAAAVMLRPGSVTLEELRDVLGPLGVEVAVSDGSPDRPTAPGQLLRHYAPRHPLRLDATTCGPSEAWLGFGGAPAPACAAFLDLSPEGSLDEAAARLFDYLRRLDGELIQGIAVAPIPAEGVGLAIRDRLLRAARSTETG